MNTLLQHVTWLNNGRLETGDVRIRNGEIFETGTVLTPEKNELSVEFGNHFIYPGLINAHDHLEMNLYPRLGKPPYPDYVEWSNAIYKPNESPIREIEKINIEDRYLWGGLKNLISGATTVVHHNPWNKFFNHADYPVHVVKEITWAHSIAFGKNIASALTDGDIPFVVHAAEGTSALAFEEIASLNKMGLLRKNSVVVHGVALNDEGANILREAQTSLVWCPSSNEFTLGAIAPIDKVIGKINIALGTDSTLTGSPTLLDEMRKALQTQKADAEEICRMVTTSPALIFHLPSPVIRPGRHADFFITPKKNPDYYQNLVLSRPEDLQFTFCKGSVQLIDPSIEPFRNKLIKPIYINRQLKFTNVDVSSLKKRILKKAGKEILEANPLWKILDA